MKQSEIQRWLAARGAAFKHGTHHLKVFLNGKQTMMPDTQARKLAKDSERRF